MSKKWLKAAGVRAIKTVAQTEVSMLTSIAGLPEVE